MKQIVQNYKEGSLVLEEVPVPALKSGCLLVQSHHSLISAGTEKMKIDDASKSLVGMAKARPDKVKQVLETLQQLGPVATYQKVMNRLDSYTPLGYSLAGRVIEVGQGVTEFQAGDMVACGGAGVANHADVNCVPVNLCVKIPKREDGSIVPTREAAFGTVGAIAMQGVRQAEVAVGEVVAVIGLGLVGQLTAMILKAAGCKVLGIDIDPAKTELANSYGVHTAIGGSDDIEQIARALSDGFGVDAIIVTTGTRSNEPIELAASIARDRATVVDVGITKMDIPWQAYFEKELDIRMSRSYGPGRYDANYEDKGQDYPIGYVRWTENRNIRSFLDLIASGGIDVRPLISRTYAFEDAVSAYSAMQSDEARNFVGLILEYDLSRYSSYGAELPLAANERTCVATVTSAPSAVNLGVIGAGNFARTMLLPHLKANSAVSLRNIATATGVSAKDTARKFEFASCTTDYSTVLQDPDINSILIATRHNLHGKLVVDSLNAGKHVYVEKPLALNEAELSSIDEAFGEVAGRQQLIVGYNRRYAPLIIATKDFFGRRSGPMALHFRVNAGFIDRSNWYQDPEIGGGRIVGEVCHFIDTMQYLTDSLPVSVFAQAVQSDDASVVQEDNVQISLKFADGSIGTVAYLANGDPKFPKEYLEVFCDGKVAVMDNFASLVTMAKGRRSKTRKVPDKGHKAEMKCLAGAFSGSAAAPISFESLYATSMATFKVLESIDKQALIHF